jgi:hypothetical protein
VDGIIFIKYLEKGKTTHGKYDISSMDLIEGGNYKKKCTRPQGNGDHGKIVRNEVRV